MSENDRRILLNPGPVTVSKTVREAMLQSDNCHREKEIQQKIQNIRNDLISFCGSNDYISTLFFSSGTGALESVIGSAIPKWETGKQDQDFTLIINNGAYGKRMEDISTIMRVPFITEQIPWGKPIDLERIKKSLESRMFSHIMIVHHETTTGILNPIKEIGELAKKYGCTYIVDAVSSFGGIPINLGECNIDFLVGVGNKCIQGLPGISFVIGNKEEMENCQLIGPKSLYFDLYSEWKSQENGGFRFTAPVQIIYALEQALKELKEETIEKRYKRYKQNYNTLIDGFCDDLKFVLYPTETPSKLLATFYEKEYVSFDTFHDRMYDQGFVIYPGKIMDEKTFRIGVMGDINKQDIQRFVDVCGKTLKELKHARRNE